METSLKTGFAQIFSCCPKNLSCPNFGLAPPARTPMQLEKRAYYAPGSVQSSWKLCRNCAFFSELCSSHLNYAAWP